MFKRNRRNVIRILMMIYVITSVITVNAQPRIEFEDTIFDFKTIYKDRVHAIYKFRNTGDKDLILAYIENGMKTCKWPRNPIRPNEQGEISLLVNSKVRFGSFQRAILVYSNSLINNPQKLIYKGDYADTSGPIISFSNTVFNFDTIPYGGWNSKAKFVYKNIGNVPLVLRHVKSSCGCLSPSWNRDPVAPGDSGVIFGMFNSRGYGGKAFHKSMTVVSNSIINPVTIISIKGYVARKPVYKTNISFEPVNKGETKYQIIANDTAVTLFCDLGKLKFGEKRTAVFRFENKGDYSPWVRCYYEDKFTPIKINIKNDKVVNNNKYQAPDKQEVSTGGYLKIIVNNNVGDIGKYSTVIKLSTNTDTNYIIKIKAEFIDSMSNNSCTLKRANQYIKKTFENGKVVRIEHFTNDIKSKEEIFEY